MQLKPDATSSNPPRGRLWLRRIAWLAVFWLGGVAAVGLLAYGLRFIVNIAGA